MINRKKVMISLIVGALGLNAGACESNSDNKKACVIMEDDNAIVLEVKGYADTNEGETTITSIDDYKLSVPTDNIEIYEGKDAYRLALTIAKIKTKDGGEIYEFKDLAKSNKNKQK